MQSKNIESHLSELEDERSPSIRLNHFENQETENEADTPELTEMDEGREQALSAVRDSQKSVSFYQNLQSTYYQLNHYLNRQTSKSLKQSDAPENLQSKEVTGRVGVYVGQPRSSLTELYDYNMSRRKSRNTGG